MIVDDKGRKEETIGEPSENGAEPVSTNSFAANLSPADEAQLEMIMGMGFTAEAGAKALRKFPSEDDPTGERKMEWLLDGGADIEEEDPLSAFMGEEDDAMTDQGGKEPNKNADANSSTDTAHKALESGADGSKSDGNGEINKQNEENGETAPKKKIREVPQALQRLFGILEKGDLSYATTVDLTKSFNWKSNHTSVQHDVHELSRVLMDVVERSLNGTSQSHLVRSLFHGTQCHQIKCLQCGMLKERSEEFGDLTLAIPRGAEFQSAPTETNTLNKGSKNAKGGNHGGNSTTNTSLEACLAHYFGLEYLSGKNQYECDACNMRTDAEIGMRMKRLPRVLCLSLARMEYDFTTGQRTKNTGRVSFPPSVDLSPYLAENSINERDSSSEHGAGSNSSTIYDLYAVIVHKGQTATSGHYHVYIKDLFNISKATEAGFEDNEDEEEEKSGDPDANSQAGFSKGGKKKNNKSKNANVEGGAAWAKVEALSDASRRANISIDEARALDSNSPESSIWFNFDDTSVRRVSSRVLPKLFSSSECAYMFFYKQRDPEALDAQLTMPAHLEAYVNTLNNELTDARELHLKEINEIDVDVADASFFCVRSSSKDSSSGIVNKSFATGTPNLRWIPTECSQGRLLLPEGESLPVSASFKFDQRQPVADMMRQFSAALDANDSIQRPLSPDRYMLMSLVRAYHDKVLLERTFVVKKDPQTGIWAMVREEKEIVPSLPLHGDIDANLNNTTVKDLSFPKTLQIVLWDGKHFNARLSVLDNSEPGQPALLGYPITEPLPFLLQAPHNVVRVRIYHQSKLTVPSASTSDASAPSDADAPTTAYERLQNLYHESYNTNTMDPTWNSVVEGHIAIEALNVSNPFITGTFVTTVSLHLPKMLKLSSVLRLLRNSKLYGALISQIGADQHSNLTPALLQPNVGSASNNMPHILNESIADDLISSKTIGDLEQLVEDAKLAKWEKRMETETEESVELNRAESDSKYSITLIDDTCGVILATDADVESLLLQNSFAVEIATILSEQDTADKEYEEAFDNDGTQATEETEETTKAAGNGTSEKTPKKKRTVDFYVVIGLKMPKSAFYIRSKDAGKETDDTSALQTRLVLNAPLPDDVNSASSADSAEQFYHPRYVIKGLPDNSTLRDVVKKVYEVSGLAPPPRIPLHSRLYSVDAFDQKDRIFDNFAVTLKQAQITPYTTLWLEEGEEPIPGLIQLNARLFRLAPNKIGSNPADNPYTKAVPTLRANLLFLPLSLSTFFQPPSATADQQNSQVNAENNGDSFLPPPPPPPPVPPTSTAFLLETSSHATLNDLKDSIIVHIEDHVRDLWKQERAKNAALGSSEEVVPSLSFFHQYFPFDYFLANTFDEKRASMTLWIDDQIMVDDANSTRSIALKSWRLNSWQKCNIAVVLTQSLPSHPIPCAVLAPEKLCQQSLAASDSNQALSPDRLIFEHPKEGEKTFMAIPSSVCAEHARETAQIFMFLRSRLNNASPSATAESNSSSDGKSNETSLAPAIPVLIDDGRFGNLSTVWLSAPQLKHSASNNPGANKKGGSKKKKGESAPRESTEVHNRAPTPQHPQLAQHAMVDVESLVLPFSSGLAPVGTDSAAIDCIPPEWLLLARIGMMPHHHGMPLPKWQLIWRPTAFVAKEKVESESDNKTSTKPNEEEEKEAKKETPKTNQPDAYGLDMDTSEPISRYQVLMKHLEDEKIPGCKSNGEAWAMPHSSKKVKLSHGDTLVYADARTWINGGAHEDVFWDEQRRKGRGGDEAFMSDLERALLESSKLASRSRAPEQALTIDVDF